MEMTLDKRTILVLGAVEDGIGDAITNRLLGEGCRVIGTYESSREAKAAALAKDNTPLSLSKLNYGSREEVIDFVSALDDDSIDGFVNVQMLFEMENPSNFDFDLWDKSVSYNFTSPNAALLAARPKFRHGASAVFVTSTEGFVGSFGASAYASTKAAIHNLVKTHANNFGSKGVRVNALAAGWIGGVMDTDEVFERSRDITPLGRLGMPEEVAAAAWFLLSDQASFVNGTTLTVDGGYTGVDTIAKFEFERAHKDNGDA